MSLKQQISDDMKAAMRAKETERLATIRLLLAAIKQKEVDERVELDDAAVAAVIEKLVKQRKDSVTQYEAAGRQELGQPVQVRDPAGEPAAHPDDRDGLARAAEAIGLRVVADDTWSDLFSKILSEKIETQLGCGRPTLLCDYPVSEAALARVNPDDPRFADRFELYACGVELANGFGELTDPDEQRRRLDAQMVEKARLYGERYPVDEDFLAALAIMPAASGVIRSPRSENTPVG